MIAASLLAPRLIVREKLTGRTNIGLKRLQLSIVPQESQLSFILWQWSRTLNSVGMNFEGRNNVECSIELLLRVRFLRVERNEMMEEIRSRKDVDVHGENVLNCRCRYTKTSDITKEIRWVRRRIGFIGMIDVGHVLATDSILDAMRVVLIGDGT